MNSQSAAERYPAIAAGHRHAEAFCLMYYQCSQCSHFERIWNSRDGVTPFCLACPSCGQPSLQHNYFGSDSYQPNHKPYFGQRIWISMTKERALQIARRNVEKSKLIYNEFQLQELADSIYHEGHAPDLAIFGYQEMRP